MLIQDGHFQTTDRGGAARTLYVYRDVPAGPGAAPRPDLIRDAGGGSVTRLGKGEYRVDETGEVLTADGPDAP